MRAPANSDNFQIISASSGLQPVGVHLSWFFVRYASFSSPMDPNTVHFSRASVASVLAGARSKEASKYYLCLDPKGIDALRLWLCKWNSELNSIRVILILANKKTIRQFDSTRLEMPNSRPSSTLRTGPLKLTNWFYRNFVPDHTYME